MGVGPEGPFTLPHGDPHQLGQDRQEDDNGGCVAGELGEEGDDHSDEQNGQHWGHVFQGVQLPADPRGQPRLLWADMPSVSVQPVPPFPDSHECELLRHMLYGP